MTGEGFAGAGNGNTDQGTKIKIVTQTAVLVVDPGAIHRVRIYKSRTARIQNFDHPVEGKGLQLEFVSGVGKE